VPLPRLLVALALLLPLSASAQPSARDAATSPDLATCLARVEPYAPHEAHPPDSAFAFRLDRPAGGALHYVGAQHRDDPADPQFAAIEAAYRAFRPTVVFYEGPERPLEATAEATIRAYGESGFVRWLAAQDGVPVARLEPGPAADFGAVAGALDAERATLFFVLREAARLRDRKGVTGDSLRQAVGALLERAASMGLPIGSLDRLAAAYARHFVTPSDWAEAPGAWFDPLADDAETGGVFMAAANRASSDARNRHMARVLAEAARRGERVFAVVGRNHVPKQAPALRCALE
jgi:hypothetical protein